MYLKRWNLIAVVAFAIGVAILSVSTAFPQSGPSNPRTQAEDPKFRSQEAQHPYDAPPAFHVKTCMTDSDCDRGFQCFGPRPETGEKGSCGNSGPGGPPKATNDPLTPHPTCLVDAECDPGRKCFGNDPANERRGLCIA